MDTSSDNEEDPALARQCRKPIKSGKLHSADTQVLCRVEWLHESVYMVDSKPAEYESLSIPLFISGYIRIMDSQKLDIKALMSAHLTELMADTELYGWEAVQAFHAIWLQQMA